MPSTIEDFEGARWQFAYPNDSVKVYVYSGWRSLAINKDLSYYYTGWRFDLPSTVSNLQCKGVTSIDFCEGKHPDLVIPEDKWGASKIIINGVEQ